MPEEVGSISTGSFAIAMSLGLLLLVLPRRYAMVPMLIGACYLTLGQSVAVGWAHFHLIRILIACGMLRIIIRGEIAHITFNAIDKLFLAWLVVRVFLYVLVSGDTESLAERLGGLYNTIGIYSLVRAVVRDFDDVILTVKLLALVTIPLAVPFLLEYTTQHNPFYVLGGVPEITQLREGKLRCQGAFAHPILAGTFGATAMPLFVGLWGHNARNRFIALTALLVATFIVFTSSSSGPLLAYLVVLIGFFCWKFKTRTREIRWGLSIFLLVLHAVMKAPVWFLISRMGELIGGGGYYRSALIDAFFDHFDEWWLFGTEYTAHWMPTGILANPKMADIVNHYVLQGVSGGLLCLVLFIWLLVKCFQTVGGVMHKEADYYSSAERFMIWALGCALLGHVASFFSVAYFDQITVFLYMTIGMIAVLVREGQGEKRGSKLSKTEGPIQFPA